MTITLTRYGRRFRHLCHEKERELEPLLVRYGFELMVVDR